MASGTPQDIPGDNSSDRDDQELEEEKTEEEETQETDPSTDQCGEEEEALSELPAGEPGEDDKERQMPRMPGGNLPPNPLNPLNDPTLGDIFKKKKQ